jgi:hypothetical protein
MDTFRTDVSINPYSHRIGLKTPILTAGSCFADAIGSRLMKNKFFISVNPTGVIYNPQSIHKALTYGISANELPEHTYLQHQGIYLNYDFHSQFSALDMSALKRQLSDTVQSMHEFLKSASWLMITYGTAWIYDRNETNEIVANCHKVPSANFTKRLASQKEIIQSFEIFYAALNAFNPSIKIILTVSPVRHVKDTLELNSVSKAILRTVCYSLSTTFDNVDYFPAFEIMIDDLRDYRFYRSDMLHPTEDAENYIWEKFSQRYFDEGTRNFIKEWEQIRTALSHKAFHPSSAAHQQFLKATLKKLENLKGTVNVEHEIKLISQQLI